MVMPTSQSQKSIVLLLLAAAFHTAEGACLANEEFDNFFANLSGTSSIPQEGSCCQRDVCGIPCPEGISTPGVGYGIAVGFAIGISFLIGLLTFFLVKGEAENYFVAGKSLPLWIVAMTLGAQSVDSNALLGNVDLSYKYQFYDGAVIPIGLGCSLILNGIFLAAKINREENVLTLPDVLARRYGKTEEVLISLATITSFLMLLAGNLVGMGVVTSYVWGISESAGIWLAAAIVWAYTVSGGLFSVAYTDVAQGAVGWTGCVILAYYMIANEPEAASPSIGFQTVDGYDYMYPNDDICQMYDGITCPNDDTACCYNAAKFCPENGTTCMADNGAYPIGDQRAFSDQLSNSQSLTPFPNAIFWNWATIFILAFGNLGALDFQVRCMAAKTPNTARIGCFIGGCFTFFIGIPFAYLGAITRVYYGPDSPHAEFDADTCSTILGLPTCGAWIPDQTAFISLLTHQAPPVLGAWCLIGIVAASMSTADGAILAMGTVFSHNIMRQLDAKYPKLVTPENLLNMARLSTIPFTIAATLIGAYYRESDNAAGATGYLLIVAFDIVLASVVAPLFGCFYTKKPSPRAALCSTVAGIIVRLVLEFTLPKDGYLLLPFNHPEFYDYGGAASTAYPTFVDAGDDTWDPSEEPCVQEQFEDYTGVDSLSAFVCGIVVFVTVQSYEQWRQKALFTLPGMVPYEKNLGHHDDDGIDKTQTTKKVEGEASDEDMPAEEDEVSDETPPEKAEGEISDEGPEEEAEA